MTRSDVRGERRLAVRATRDRELLLGFLDQDRIYAAYAIADMDDSEFSRTRWAMTFDGDDAVAAVMEYRGLSPQPLFVMGSPEGVRAALSDIVRPRIAYLAAKPGVAAALSDLYRVGDPAVMARMSVDRASFAPVPGDAVRLDAADVGHLNRLYELGRTAWLPSGSVATGVYFGVRRGSRLIAAAGTHVIGPMYGIVAVGNVFTNREYRGQGLAKVVTSAVTAELLKSVDTVVLNVRADNPSALAAYRALGYREHTHFEERLVHRRSSLWDSITLPIKRLLPTLRRNG
ncbi:MAG: GNAT family N-acetyltransferase [Chloroflexota bacterium]